MPRTPPWLQSLLEEHLEEIQMLGELRAGAYRDPDHDEGTVRELDERIEAHMDALIISREHAEPMLLEGLKGGEPSVVFAAVVALLRLDDSAWGSILTDSLAHADGDDLLDAYAAALCLAPIRSVESLLANLVHHARSPIAAVAAEALAFHGKLDDRHSRIAELVLDDSPAVRERGWRIVSHVGR